MTAPPIAHTISHQNVLTRAGSMPNVVGISNDSSGPDIFSRSIVIYGAGADCLKLLRMVEHSQAFELSSISCIIDGNPAKQGTELEYDEMRFPICSPDILRSLDPSSHVIIISSRRYADRMVETIRQTIPSSPLPVIADCSRFLRPHYGTVEELLASDPIVREGMRHSGWSEHEDRLLQLFRSAFAHAHGDTDADFFFPIPGGMNGLLLGYEVDGEPFVFRAQRVAIIVGGEYFKGGPPLAQELARAAAQAGIGTELLVYHDGGHCRIEHYASPLTSADIDEEGFRSEVLALLGRLHALESPHPFRKSLLEAWCNAHMDALPRLLPHYQQQFLVLQSLFLPLFSAYQELPFKPCICHGEPQLTNIVRYKGRLVLIDWDSITVDDPLYDVCLNLFSMMMRCWWPAEMPYGELQRTLFGGLDETLRLYYGRPCTQLEHRRAALITKCIEILKLMEWSAIKGRFDTDRYDAVVASCANWDAL